MEQTRFGKILSSEKCSKKIYVKQRVTRRENKRRDIDRSNDEKVVMEMSKVENYRVSTRSRDNYRYEKNNKDCKKRSWEDSQERRYGKFDDNSYHGTVVNKDDYEDKKSKNKKIKKCKIDNEEIQPQALTHICCLYPEILGQIFSNLDVRSRGRAAQVCTLWREAAYQKFVWRGVKAKIHLTKPLTAAFRCLEKRGINRVQVLSLSTGLDAMFRGISHLQSLNLSDMYNCVRLSDAVVNNALFQNFPSLTKLNLSFSKYITDASLAKIAHHLKNLEVLQLDDCENITNTGLLYIASGHANLKRLDLRGCCNISDQGLAYLAGLSDKSPCNLKLEHLDLTVCRQVTDDGLSYLSVGMSNSLQLINLSFCDLITNTGMKHLAKIASLRSLDLSFCGNISETGIMYLTKGSCRISSFNVSFCNKITDLALQHISQSQFNLKSLNVTGCPITVESIYKFAKSQQYLENLDVGMFDDLYGCTIPFERLRFQVSML